MSYGNEDEQRTAKLWDYCTISKNKNYNFLAKILHATKPEVGTYDSACVAIIFKRLRLRLSRKYFGKFESNSNTIGNDFFLNKL